MNEWMQIYYQIQIQIYKYRLGTIMGRVQLMGMFHSFALIVNSLIN